MECTSSVGALYSVEHVPYARLDVPDETPIDAIEFIETDLECHLFNFVVDAPIVPVVIFTKQDFSGVEDNDISAERICLNVRTETMTEREARALISRLKGEAHGRVGTAKAILGCVRFTRGYYLLLVTQRKLVGRIGLHRIFEIADVTMLYLWNDPLSGAATRALSWTESMASFLFGRKTLESTYRSHFCSHTLKHYFYYSHTYDLSNTLQTNMTVPRESRCRRMKYIWNSFLLEPFQQTEEGMGSSYCGNTFATSSADGSTRTRSDTSASWEWSSYKGLPDLVIPASMSRWVVYTVHGAITQRSVWAGSKHILLTLIGRASKEFAGVRYLRRGVSSDGNAANHVEVEQIVCDESACTYCFSKGAYASYVQVRGSVPLHWYHPSSSMPKPPIVVGGSDVFHNSSCKHFQELLADYGAPIVVLSLLKREEKRPRESILGRAYEAVIRHLMIAAGSSPFGIQREAKEVSRGAAEHVLHYNAIDLRRLARRAWNVISASAEGDLRRTCFFVARRSLTTDTSSSTYPSVDKVQRQHGVVRSNCVDCVDRTNIAQYIYGLHVLGHQLHALGLLHAPVDLVLSPHVGDVLLHMYLFLGDAIAKQYGGSAQVGAGVLHRGAGWDQLMGIQRFYNNMLGDRDKQAVLNVFLGRFQAFPSHFTQSTNRVLCPPQPACNWQNNPSHNTGTVAGDGLGTVSEREPHSQNETATMVNNTVELRTAVPRSTISMTPAPSSRSSLSMLRHVTIISEERRCLTRNERGSIKSARGHFNIGFGEDGNDYYLQVKGGPSLPDPQLLLNWWKEPLQYHAETYIANVRRQEEFPDSACVSAEAQFGRQGESVISLCTAERLRCFESDEVFSVGVALVEGAFTATPGGSRRTRSTGLTEQGTVFGSGVKGDAMNPKDFTVRLRCTSSSTSLVRSAESREPLIPKHDTPTVHQFGLQDVLESSPYPPQHLQCQYSSLQSDMPSPDEAWSHLRHGFGMTHLEDVPSADEMRMAELVHDHVTYPKVVRRSLYQAELNDLRSSCEKYEFPEENLQQAQVYMLSVLGDPSEWSCDQVADALLLITPTVTEDTLHYIRSTRCIDGAALLKQMNLERCPQRELLCLCAGLARQIPVSRKELFTQMASVEEWLPASACEDKHVGPVISSDRRDECFSASTDVSLEWIQSTCTLLQPFFREPLYPHTVLTVIRMLVCHAADDQSGVNRHHCIRYVDSKRSDGGHRQRVPTPVVHCYCFSATEMLQWLLSNSERIGLTLHNHVQPFEATERGWRLVWWMVQAGVMLPVHTRSSMETGVVAEETENPLGKLSDPTSLYRLAGALEKQTLNDSSLSCSATRAPRMSHATSSTALAESFADLALSTLTTLEGLSTPHDAQTTMTFIRTLLGRMNEFCIPLRDRVDLSLLHDSMDAWTFWINIYNALFVHAWLAATLQPAQDAATFYETSGYVIGGLYFSLSDIKNGILRGNRQPFYALLPPFTETDYRTRFILRSPLASDHSDPLADVIGEIRLYCGIRSRTRVSDAVAKRVTSSVLEEQMHIIDKAAAAIRHDREYMSRRVLLSLIDTYVYPTTLANVLGSTPTPSEYTLDFTAQGSDRRFFVDAYGVLAPVDEVLMRDRRSTEGRTEQFLGRHSRFSGTSSPSLNEMRLMLQCSSDSDNDAEEFSRGATDSDEEIIDHDAETGNELHSHTTPKPPSRWRQGFFIATHNLHSPAKQTAGGTGSTFLTWLWRRSDAGSGMARPCFLRWTPEEKCAVPSSHLCVPLKGHHLDDQLRGIEAGFLHTVTVTLLPGVASAQQQPMVTLRGSQFPQLLLPLLQYDEAFGSSPQDAVGRLHQAHSSSTTALHAIRSLRSVVRGGAVDRHVQRA